jgi:hypothetical protein
MNLSQKLASLESPMVSPYGEAAIVKRAGTLGRILGRLTGGARLVQPTPATSAARLSARNLGHEGGRSVRSSMVNRAVNTPIGRRIFRIGPETTRKVDPNTGQVTFSQAADINRSSDPNKFLGGLRDKLNLPRFNPRDSSGNLLTQGGQAPGRAKKIVQNAGDDLTTQVPKELVNPLGSDMVESTVSRAGVSGDKFLGKTRNWINDLTGQFKLLPEEMRYDVHAPKSGLREINYGFTPNARGSFDTAQTFLPQGGRVSNFLKNPIVDNVNRWGGAIATGALNTAPATLRQFGRPALLAPSIALGGLGMSGDIWGGIAQAQANERMQQQNKLDEGVNFQKSLELNERAKELGQPAKGTDTADPDSGFPMNSLLGAAAGGALGLGGVWIANQARIKSYARDNNLTEEEAEAEMKRKGLLGSAGMYGLAGLGGAAAGAFGGSMLGGNTNA